MRMAAAMRAQARACAGLGSPFMARLLTLLADNWSSDSVLGRSCDDWVGDLGPSGASLPLRLAGALHALVLTGRAPALAAVYPPNEAADDVLIRTVLAAIDTHQAFVLDWMKSPPQTNEVRRSSALIPAAHWIAARHPLPFMTSELGASAGLNLMWDSFALDTPAGSLGPRDPALVLQPDWGGPFPADAGVRVNDRAGVDLKPLDMRDPEQVLRLFAYLWPDQPHRAELTRAAIAVQTVRPEAGDAISWLERRLATQPAGTLHLIYHTIAWQYFPAERQQVGTALIEDAGARATTDRPLAWLGMEADGNGDGAALTLRLWPDHLTVTLARVDFHGRWVKWLAD